MTAVLEKRPTKARGNKALLAKQPAPSTTETANLFEQAGNVLQAASGTDEAHGYRCESDRLLRIAASVAFDAASGKLSSTTSANTAYDIAACINAARLVPGDAESAQRTSLITCAAESLAAITGDEVRKMIFDDVPRPSAPPRVSTPPSTPAPAHPAAVYSQMPAAMHDELSMHLLSADAVVFALEDLFSGVSTLKEPRSVASDDLMGLLQCAKQLLNTANKTVLYHQGALPDDLRTRLFEATSLINVVEEIEYEGSFQFIWSDDQYQNYFFTVRHCIKQASNALNQVPI